MNDYKELNALLEKDEWVSAIDYLLKEEAKNPDDVDIAINLVYCYGIYLSEKCMDMNELDRVTEKSILYFHRAYAKFSNNPDFLFYAGFMVCIGEWNYGVEDFFGGKMMQRAFEQCPDNEIFKLGQHLSSHEEYVSLRKKVFGYLSSNGFDCVLRHGPMGEYFLDCYRPKEYE